MNYQAPFDKKEIENIIWMGESRKQALAGVYGGGSSPGVDTEVRAVDMSVIPPEKESEWLYEKMSWFFYDLNVHRLELMQYLVYRPGGFFTWHNDNGHGSTKNIGDISRRVATGVINLSDPSEYDGGGLEIETPQGSVEAPTEKGRVSVFSSEIYHRVKPITRGIRRILICWGLSG